MEYSLSKTYKQSPSPIQFIKIDKIKKQCHNSSILYKGRIHKILSISKVIDGKWNKSI